MVGLLNASLLLQRDLGRLASLLSSEAELLKIPKTIIYCQTKDNACKVFSFLKKASKAKHAVGVYHASLSELHKTFVQTTFQSSTSELRCLVATVAFGMVCKNKSQPLSCYIYFIMINVKSYRVYILEMLR